MNYKAKVLFRRYQDGVAVKENEYHSDFNSELPLMNRSEAFKYCKNLEEVFEYELDERKLTLNEVNNLPDTDKNGIYYESSIWFYSSRLEDNVNLFNPSSELLEESELHWYQIGLIEEVIELKEHVTLNVLDDYLIIDDFGRIVLKENLHIICSKVTNLEVAWTSFLIKK